MYIVASYDNPCWKTRAEEVDLMICPPIENQDPLIQDLIRHYFAENAAARIYLSECERQGWPVILDHITLRCLDVARRAAPFLARGYVDSGELIEYPDQGWWARVYRQDNAPGRTAPALFVDQAYADARGEASIIPAWVARFTDQVLHHVAVRVSDIEVAVAALEKRGVGFSGTIVGASSSRLRQIFTVAELRNGAAFSVLELTERNGYDGFSPEQANRLMQSSTQVPATPKSAL